VSGITDAVIPVAGLGTRLLPATKSQPKEMLPVVGKPVVQYVVEELAEAGIGRALFVTGRGKTAIEDHFDSDPELVRRLREAGREELLARLAYERMGVDFLYTRQAEQRGLGDAVLCAERFAGESPFALALGDSIIAGAEEPVVTRLAGELEAAGAAGALAVEEVGEDEVSRRGMVVAEGDSSPGPGEAFAVVDLVEKPKPQEVSSRLAIAARYVFSPAIFEELRALDPAGGELELTDAIRALARAGKPVIAVRLPEGARRHDVGTVGGYCRTFIELALSDEQLGPELREHARSLLS
jgi:UTP--glucose-1-phosphate uridylyltransferase